MEEQVLIVEDDTILAEKLKRYLNELDYQNVTIATNDKSLNNIDATHPIAFCLIDINLCNIVQSGAEVVDKLKIGEKIPLIYLSANGQNGTCEEVKKTKPSAYLTKPINKKKLKITIDYALNNFASRKNGDALHGLSCNACPYASSLDFYFIKSGERYEKVYGKDIVFLEAAGSYCCLHTRTRKYTVTANLKSMLEQLNHHNIYRCHRSYAINIHHIHSFDDMEIALVKGGEVCMVPLGKKYKDKVMAWLPRLKAD